MKTLLKIFDRQEHLFIFLSFWIVLVQVFFELRIPDFMSELTHITQTAGFQLQDIWWIGGQMLLFTLAAALLSLVQGYFSARIGSRYSLRLRSLLFSKVDAFSTEDIKHFSTPSLITRSTNDISTVQMFFILVLQLSIRSPLMAMFAIYKIAGKGFWWTLSTSLFVVVLLALIVGIMFLVIPRFKKMQSLVDRLNLVTRENIKGLRVVHAYHATDYQEKKFDKANLDLTENHLYVSKSLAFIFPLVTLFISLVSLSIYFIGAFTIADAPNSERLTLFSNMVVFSSYAVQVIMSFLMMIFLFMQFPRASVSAKRIEEVLLVQDTLQNGTKTEGKADAAHKVEFSQLRFRYQGAEEAVLDDVSFTVNKGEKVALIGSTGSGKSTLLQLIPRFYDATSGELKIDGISVKDYDLQALREKIAYVPQKAFLFSGSIESNLVLGQKEQPLQENLEKAVRLANAENFVKEKENQYQADVAQAGANFSGGQKQRLSLARAFLKKAEIYLFDDSFSALDYKTEKEIREQLKKEAFYQEATVFLVAQRVASIMDFDKILVLNEGKLVGMGKHKDLLQNCDVYKEIAKSQLSEEELQK